MLKVNSACNYCIKTHSIHPQQWHFYSIHWHDEHYCSILTHIQDVNFSVKLLFYLIEPVCCGTFLWIFGESNFDEIVEIRAPGKILPTIWAGYLRTTFTTNSNGTHYLSEKGGDNLPLVFIFQCWRFEAMFGHKKQRSEKCTRHPKKHAASKS